MYRILRHYFIVLIALQQTRNQHLQRARKTHLRTSLPRQASSAESFNPIPLRLAARPTASPAARQAAHMALLLELLHHLVPDLRRELVHQPPPPLLLRQASLLRVTWLSMGFWAGWALWSGWDCCRAVSGRVPQIYAISLIAFS